MPSRPTQPLKQPVQRRAQLTVQAILEAAVQVFEKHGHAAGTTARIAERAGISVGSLYQYFPNKDAILVALAHLHLEDANTVAGKLLEQLRAEEVPLATIIERLVDGFLALHARNPGLHRLLYEEGLLPEELRQAARRLEQYYTGALAQLLARHPEVRRDDPELQAWFVVQMLEHFTHALVLQPPARRIRQAAADELKRLLRQYLGAAEVAQPKPS